MLLGGGGIFHDYWGFDPDAVLTSYHSGIGFYSSFPVLATLLNKPLMLYAVGVGPLESELGKRHTLTAFQQARLATVRDAESKHLLERLGINPQQIRVTADPAFSHPPAPPERVQSILLETGLPKERRPLLGVAVRNWNVGVLPNWERQVADALDQFIERHAACALFVPLQNLQGELTDDFAAGERVRQRMRHADRTVNFRGSTLAQEKAGLLAACDVVVAMRLHSLIFALRSRVPAVALIYDPKVRHLMAQMECEHYGLELPSMNAHALSELLERAYHERGRLQVHLNGRVESLVDHGAGECPAGDRPAGN